MLIDFDRLLLDLRGAPLKRDDKPFSLRDACQEALLANFSDEANLPGAEKLKRFTLAMKINPSQVEVSHEEIVLIETLVAKTFGPLVVGRVHEQFDDMTHATPPKPPMPPIHPPLHIPVGIR
jgi:hypothetical protein